MPINLNRPFEGRTPIQPDAGGKTAFLPQLVTWVSPTYLDDAVSRIRIRTRAVFSRLPAAPLNPDLRITALWRMPDVKSVGAGSYGGIVDSYITDAISSIKVNTFVRIAAGVAIEESISSVAIDSYADIYIEASTGWVSWSDIGHLDFTLKKSNVAGRRPVDIGPLTYGIRKLGNRVIAYGGNGIVELIPSNNAYGMRTIHYLGLMGTRAFCGSDDVHYFIDSENRLCKLTDNVEVLGYEEYMEDLSEDVIMSFDKYKGFVYICDGELGFVFSTTSGSLGIGPANITGVDYRYGKQYVTSDGDIAIPPFKICTDIYDLGTRKPKNIFSLELGTDLKNSLFVSVDYRVHKSDDFTTIPWCRVNPDGLVQIPCFGVEFRFRIKQITYEYFELDYIKINGVIYRYSYLDTYR